MVTEMRACPTGPLTAPPTAPPITFTVAAEATIAAGVPPALRRAITQALTLPNPQFLEVEEHGRSTADLDADLYYYRGTATGELVVPRGAGRLVRALFEEHGVPLQVVDATHFTAPVAFEEYVTLSAAQERAVGDMLRRRIGVLEAPAGSGKTVMGLVCVARRQQPALWITHTKELAHQAVERAGMVLGLAPDEVGFIGDGEWRVGDRLTVALVQTLARGIPPALLDVGHVVVDECHHCPAASMASVVLQFPAKYLAGLSATVYRRDGLDRVIGFYLGETVARIDPADLADRLITPRIVKRHTNLRPEGNSFTELVSDLVVWPERNALIAGDVAEAVAAGRRCLILSERVGHVQELTRLLQGRGIAAAALYGTLGKRKRGEVVEALGAGELRAVVATVSLISEGFDCPHLDALFLATPMSYGGRVIQAIGRVSRTAPGKVDAVVTDYVDSHPMFFASWRNRRLVYEAQDCVVSTPPATPTTQRRNA